MDHFVDSLKNVSSVEELVNFGRTADWNGVYTNATHLLVNSHPLLKELDPKMVVAVVSMPFVLVLLFTLYLVSCILACVWGLLTGKGSKPRIHVLLMGPEDVGKTRMFLSMTNNCSPVSCTSLKENTAVLSADQAPGKSRGCTLVDVPGSGRIAWPIFDKYKWSVRSIYFLVDSCALFKTQRAQTGEYLFRILTDPAIAKLRPPITVVCTKQDLQMAKSVALVKQVVQQELTTLRQTSQATLQDTSGGQNSAALNVEKCLLLDRNGTVDLAKSPLKITFASSQTAKDGSVKISYDV